MCFIFVVNIMFGLVFLIGVIVVVYYVGVEYRFWLVFSGCLISVVDMDVIDFSNLN